MARIKTSKGEARLRPMLMDDELILADLADAEEDGKPSAFWSLKGRMMRALDTATTDADWEGGFGVLPAAEIPQALRPVERRDRRRSTPGRQRAQLRDTAAGWALARAKGKPSPPGPVPLLYTVRLTARSWGVPPWVVTGEEPTPEVVALWARRERIFRTWSRRGSTETITLNLVAADLASGNIAKAIGGIDKMAQRGGLMGSVMQGVGIQFGMMLNPMTLAMRGFGMVTDFMGDAISAASDLEESQAKVGQVFTDTADDISGWAADSAHAFGLSEQAALEAAGTFGNFIQALGNSEEQANEMSKTIVELAADLASFNNTGIDEALVALRSGLAGEAEPMRRLGVSLSAARVEAYVLAKGMAKSKGAITDAMKVSARYAIIMEDTSKAQGDFSRTAGGAANQARILEAETTNLQAAIGEKLIPYQKTWNETLLTTLDLLDQVIGFADSSSGGPVGEFVETEQQAMKDYQSLADKLGIGQEELGRRIWATGAAFRSYRQAMQAVNAVGAENLTMSSDQALELKRFDSAFVSASANAMRFASTTDYTSTSTATLSAALVGVVGAIKGVALSISSQIRDLELFAEAVDVVANTSFKDLRDEANAAGKAIRKAFGQDADKSLKQLRSEERKLSQQRARAVADENWAALALIDTRKLEVDEAIKAQRRTRKGYEAEFKAQEQQKKQIRAVANQFDVSQKKVKRLLEREGGDIDAVTAKLEALDGVDPDRQRHRQHVIKRRQP